MRRPIEILWLTLLLVIAGCSKRPNVVFDTVVQPSGPPKTAQLFVKNSDPVMPGSRVDIVMGDAPAHALVADVVVQAARWKVTEPGKMPAYPADGFVTLTLSQNQWDSFLSKQDLRLLLHTNQNNH